MRAQDVGRVGVAFFALAVLALVVVAVRDFVVGDVIFAVTAIVVAMILVAYGAKVHRAHRRLLARGDAATTPAAEPDRR